MSQKTNTLTRGKKQKALALLQHNQPAAAIPLLEQVCLTDQRDTEAWFLLAAAYQELGGFAKAADAYRRTIEIEPGHVEAHYYLGNTCLALGDGPGAVAAFQETIRLRPDHLQARINLGALYELQKNFAAAEECFRGALRLEPLNPELHYNLGNVLQAQERHEESLAAYRQALQLHPAHTDTCNNLGNTLAHLERYQEAVECYEQVLAINPDLEEVWNNMGNALSSLRRTNEAVRCYRQALKIQPRYDTAYSNLGNALLAQHRLDEAMAAYREAIRLNPENADAHFNLSMALLLTGNFREGWKKFEWRWRTGQLRPRSLTQPLWDGSDLHGHTILLHAEAGLGDTLQFIRYAPLVAGCGGRVIVECQPPLKRMLARMSEDISVFARGELLPTFDVHCPLLSLPWLLGTTLETIPADIPYLAADPDEVSTWRARLSPDGRLKVGLVWSGGPRKHDPEYRRMNQIRSFLLTIYAPLAHIAGVQFYSLQKGEAAQQARHPPDGMVLADHTEALHDFADTAALIANLDLVISVDTSVAHLAGALGKPVWLLSRYNGCWRWLTDRSDTPWYPTMRVFRQQTPDGWDDTMSEVVTALRRLSGP